MKIFYDNIIFSLQKAGGISLYWSKLIDMSVLKKKHINFFGFNNKNIFQNKNISFIKETNIMAGITRYIPFLKKIPDKSIFHSSYYRVSLQKRVVNITTVHDFTYEYFGIGIAKYIHIWQKKFAITKSSGIICVSENTKNDLLKFYPDIDKEKIKVIYNGVDDGFRRLYKPFDHLKGDYKVLKNRKYLLYVGYRSGYKNFNLAIDTLSGLDDYSIVVVGGGIFNKNEKIYISEIRERVFHFTNISESALNILYNNAFCLLYPSGYEGFGIPIVEAMRSGCPVVSVNISSIPEVCGDACLLARQPDSDIFIEKITKLENFDYRKKIIAKGLMQSKKFSWDKCFDKTYDFYKEIAKGK